MQGGKSSIGGWKARPLLNDRGAPPRAPERLPPPYKRPTVRTSLRVQRVVLPSKQGKQIGCETGGCGRAGQAGRARGRCVVGRRQDEPAACRLQAARSVAACQPWPCAKEQAAAPPSGKPQPPTHAQANTEKKASRSQAAVKARKRATRAGGGGPAPSSRASGCRPGGPAGQGQRAVRAGLGAHAGTLLPTGPTQPCRASGPRRPGDQRPRALGSPPAPARPLQASPQQRSARPP